MRIILLVTAALILLVQTPVFAQSCNCSEQFDWLQQKLALNYAGYRDKVTEDTRSDFERHTASFQEKIAASSTDTACYRLMSAWVKWLQEGHLYLGYKDTPRVENPDSIRRRFADRERIALPLPFSIKQPDAVTLVLRVAPIRYDKRQVLDSLIKANRRLLERTPNLIIDCRGNRGGSDMTFAELRPYVYSGTARGLSRKVYSTRDNIEMYVLLQKNKRYSRSQRRSYGRLVKMMKKHEGSFIGNCEIRKNRPEKISPYPKKVAILIDRGCAGSCEEFIYYARQSSRVTLIGQNTAGVMDYGNVHYIDFPCGKFTVGYPTARSCRVDAGQGIDGTGMPPAVRIDDDKTDWVAFAKAYLEQK